MADQAASPPFGTNLTYPLDRYTRLHQTSGSSGTQPLRWLDTAESWEWWERAWAEHIYPAARVGPRDRVFCAFSFGPFIGFWSAFCGAERMGAMAISGGAMTTEQRARAILELGVTALCCTPTYALRLAETATGLGLDLSVSAVQAVICAGEPGASVPATRALIERAYGARVFDHSGMTELGPTGFGCTAGGGLHLLQSEFVFEVSADGELIATNLGRWGSPLIRYRTGDRVALSPEPCPCGSPFAKLAGGILGRVDDMFTVRGVKPLPEPGRGDRPPPPRHRRVPDRAPHGPPDGRGGAALRVAVRRSAAGGGAGRRAAPGAGRAHRVPARRGRDPAPLGAQVQAAPAGAIMRP